MDYYVLLTGGKNNAGDFLIKHRAKNLLKTIRDDRNFVDINAWEPIEGEKLDLVNKSKGLLLTGGPALVSNIYNGTYRLNQDLDNIKVPIISFGIGWNSEKGNWEDVNDYGFSSQSHHLLKRLSNNGFYNSVRDYHTYQVMKDNGVENVLMTGCPALYEQSYFGKGIELDDIGRLTFH
ncbi:polysaccharide pyruvyl transferase family protein [Gracilimonas sp. BCB1]|uniref:polysaccharide pyruvyl transferase family protein n=1 Tax=Gracilimonas sp. BCB1 TaxID=3152362 RepID=UPI003F854E35